MFWAAVEFIDLLITGRMGFFLVFFVVCSLFFLVKYYYYKQYKQPEGTYDSPVSIVCACYKEKAWLFEKCLSTVTSGRNDELIIVFDGENTELEPIAHKYSNKVHVLSHRGKRDALAHGISKASHEIVVCIDSDTFFEQDCITKIINPFSNDKIGAVSSNQRIFHPEKSLIRTFANLFEIASHDFNQLGESARGHIGCLFGRCVAFRRNILINSLDYYLNETFLGVKCAGSDDRLLTDSVIKQGYQTVIRKDAMCYTDCPDTWGGYIAQQRRWQNGSQRSTVSRFSWLWCGSKVTAISFIFHIILPFWAVMVWFNWGYMALNSADVWLVLPLQTHLVIGLFGAVLTWSQRSYFIFGKSNIYNVVLWFFWMGIIQVIISTYSFIEIFAQKNLAASWRTK